MYIHGRKYIYTHTYRWGRFLAVGGFKQVFMAYNTDENRTEAVSVMDLQQMEETGNVHVADMEVRLGFLFLCVYLCLMHVCVHICMYVYAYVRSLFLCLNSSLCVCA